MAQGIEVLQGPIFKAGSPYSDVLDLAGRYVVGLITPLDWTPAQASVLVSPEGDNYYDLFDGMGHEFFFNIVPGAMINVDPNTLMMAAFMRLRSGARAIEIPQEAERRFYTIVKASIASAQERPA
jgi:hypothetical protein